ncbi:MAG TPA: DNA-binding response regulator [Lachnoclostridium phytofermentans]|uniref:Stage 0 sporulation protein A homolog n=1 Tax=Lachnoclostridium phytofermentans TaxID=66219 RepID=A0A3D2X9L1_9FIRM|nr:response regulator transcription factor [Lachnoclostridium sp.]HCL03829.1 DNA-binding response regulator [Lachnoclostridium phytofermentans]
MRLLVVEDELNIATAMEKILKKDGYAVDVALTGREAEDLMVINEYDLILLDIRLPDTDGFTILSKLREVSETVRVIIVSANREIDDRIKGLDLGANDYIVKPFDVQELRARIRALLRRNFVVKPNIIKIEEMEIDLTSHRVSYQNRELILTMKEYSILVYLAENKGKSISAEELYNHIWNEDSNPFTSVMRVHIYSLRKKLSNATGRDDIITNVKGLGYSLNLD